jgi:hypothetical protein
MTPSDAGAVSYVTSALLFGPSNPNSGQTIFEAISPLDPGNGPNTVLVVGLDLSAGSPECGTMPAVSKVIDDKNQTYSRFSTLGLDFGRCDAGQNVTSLEIWYAIAPASGPTTITVTYASPPPDAGYLSFGAIAFSGVDPVTPLRNASTASEATATPTISVSVATTPNDMVSEIVCNGTGPPTPDGTPYQRVGWESSEGAVSCASASAGWVPAQATTYGDTWAVANDYSAVLAFDVVRAP